MLIERNAFVLVYFKVLIKCELIWLFQSYLIPYKVIFVSKTNQGLGYNAKISQRLLLTVLLFLFVIIIS